MKAILLLFVCLSANAQRWIVDNGDGIEWFPRTPYTSGVFANVQEGAAISNSPYWYFTNGVDLINLTTGAFMASLAGDESNSQAYIARVNDTMYFFVCDDYDQTQTCHYAAVDVVNDLFIYSRQLSGTFCEKITGVRKSCDEIWILHQNTSGQYEVRLLNQFGLQPPLIQPTAETLHLEIGCAKIDHGMLISTNFATGTGEVNLYDFDINTGLITNRRTHNLTAAYGCEFDFSGKYAYVGQRGGNNDIYLWDIPANTLTSIRSYNYNVGHLLRGADNLVYARIFTINALTTIDTPQVFGSYFGGWSGLGIGLTQRAPEPCPQLLHLDTNRIVLNLPPDTPQEWCKLFTISGSLVYEGDFNFDYLPNLAAGVYIRMDKYGKFSRIVIK